MAGTHFRSNFSERSEFCNFGTWICPNQLDVEQRNSVFVKRRNYVGNQSAVGGEGEAGLVGRDGGKAKAHVVEAGLAGDLDHSPRGRSQDRQIGEGELSRRLAHGVPVP
jgi:hypothetical protein